MKKLILLSFILGTPFFAAAQTFCNTNGNLVIYTNYDGGALNINVDQNIPNLKIGIVGYEATYITLSGTYVNNVTGIVYAGYNGTNNHCGSTNTTSFSGLPSGLSGNIIFAPTANLSNANGYGSIICGYSCSTTSNQGGCNTVDQIESYMLNYFSGSVIYFHKVQYGCWSGTQTLSGGGTCCALAIPLTVSGTVSPATCSSVCNGSITPSGSGGTPPYTYASASGFTNLCPGAYVISVTDASSATATDTVIVGTANTTAPPSGDTVQTFCVSATVADLTATGSGIQWFSDSTGGTLLSATDQLQHGSYYFAGQTVGGCTSDSRLMVRVEFFSPDITIAITGSTLYSSATGVTFQWINCDSNQVIGGITTSWNYQVTQSGSYAVIVTENGCSDTSECVFVDITGLDEHAENTTFLIMPNPVKEQFSILADEGLAGQNYIISTIDGRIVHRGKLQAGRNDVRAESWSSGIYLVTSGKIQQIFTKQ